MKTVQSYLSGEWREGDVEGSITMINPSTEEAIASVSTRGLDLKGALNHARAVGGPGLRAMTFGARAALLGELSKCLQNEREALISVAITNGGNTRSDAKFDLDGATGTLHAYSKMGATLGDLRWLPEEEVPLKLSRSGRWCARHIQVPRHGVAIHINAFNFPAWGLFEKLAVAILAGMPVLTKPAPSTALLAVEMVRIIVDAKILPEGALQLLSGGHEDLLDHVHSQDVIAFTGSYETAKLIRQHPAVVAAGTPVNVEADSVNAAVVAPDVEEGSDTFHLFLKDISREITQKAGQKCTAIRRVFIPEDRIDAFQAGLIEHVGAVIIGDPSHSDVRMGPLNDLAQKERFLSGVKILKEKGARLVSPETVPLVDASFDKGAFVAPTILRADDSSSDTLHQLEVFGPIAILMPYSGDVAEAVELVNRGGGGLVACLYSDDAAFVERFVLDVSPYHGRIYIGDAKCAAQSWGSGAVMPILNHGGPGRAGGGSELGGLHALHTYTQRVALQGSRKIMTRTFATPKK